MCNVQCIHSFTVLFKCHIIFGPPYSKLCTLFLNNLLFLPEVFIEHLQFWPQLNGVALHHPHLNLN